MSSIGGRVCSSDRGGEYYGKYDGSGEQHPGPFAKFLEECGIVPQYTMPVTPRISARPDWRIRTGFRDARLRTGTLFFFFFKSQLAPVGMAHIL